MKFEYIYRVVDSAGKVCHSRGHIFQTRERARAYKRSCEHMNAFGELPPYKVVRYKLGEQEVVR